MATIYYCYDKKTGRFMGSGITQVDNAKVGSTTKVPDEELAQEEEMDWQWKDGKWIREKVDVIDNTDLTP